MNFYFTIDIYIYEDPMRRPCLFLSDHQMTRSRQWTCQEQSADMVANFGSMCKISKGDAQAQEPARQPPNTQVYMKCDWSFDQKQK